MAETSLKKQIMSGMVWKFAERFIAQGVSFVVSLVLARILMPSDYGIIAVMLTRSLTISSACFAESFQ